MINKLKEVSKSKKFLVVAFVIVLALQLAFILYNGFVLKDGYGSDEIWCYGLANSYDKPFLHGYEHDGSDYTNEWFTGEDLHDYVTVQEGEQFSYASVWYNQSKDVHPPLYYAILHTICSFFPNTFSKWFGYSINIVAFIVTQIFVFKVAKKVSKSTVTAFATIVLWGFSLGVIGLYIYIRMYTMSTMFMVMLMYVHTLIYEHGTFNKRFVVPLVVLTMCGGLTHYYFYICACMLAVLFCLWFIFKKQFKNLFAYGFSMVGGVALALIIFPSAIEQMLGGEDLINMPGMTPFAMNLPSLLNHIFSETIGFTVPIFYTGQHAYVLTAIVILAIVIVPLSFLFRKETWFKEFVVKLKLWAKNTKVRLKETFKRFNWMLFFILIDVLATIVIEATQVSQFFGYTQRYLWIVYPLSCIFFVCFAKYVLSWLPKVKKFANYLIMVVAVVCPIVTNSLYDCKFLFNRNLTTAPMEELVDGSNCIFMTSDSWSLTCYDLYLSTANDIYVSSYFIESDPYTNHTDEYLKLKDDDKFYIIIDTAKITIDDETETTESETEYSNIVYDGDIFSDITDNYPSLKEMVEYFENLYPDKTITKVSTENVFGHMTNIYEVA